MIYAKLSCSCVIAIACIIVFLNEINGDGEVESYRAARYEVNGVKLQLIIPVGVIAISGNTTRI